MAGGGAATDAVSTTTTSSPAPEWLRREVLRQSVSVVGLQHGDGWVAPFATLSEVVAATVSDDRVQNVADPPVYVVVLRGDFVFDGPRVLVCSSIALAYRG